MNYKFDYMVNCNTKSKKVKDFTNDVSVFYKSKNSNKEIKNIKNLNNQTKQHTNFNQTNQYKNFNQRNTRQKSSIIPDDNKDKKYNTSTNDKTVTYNAPKKIKHYDSSKRNLENLSQKKFISKKNINVEDESFLLLPAVSSRQKSQIILKNKMHPKDFGVDIKSNNIRKVNQYTSYYGDHHGPGRGFGNHDINNIIRNGEPSRIDRDKYNLKIESNMNTRQDILFKNYQNPDHLILPFPRGGEITRKTHLNKDYKKPTNDEIQEFTFKY